MLKKVDIFGPNLSLKSKEGSDQYQTSYGGILSIFVFIATSAIGSFFLFVFFQRQESTLISSFKTSELGYIKDFGNFPLMVKFTQPGSLEFPIPEQTWRFYPLLYQMDPLISTKYNLTRVDYDRCTYDRFPGFVTLIREHVKDIESYFCFDFKNSIFNLTGTYGSPNFNQFFSLRLRGCFESNENGKPCLSPDEVDKYMNYIFLDLRILNANIDHTKEYPVQYEILGQRVPLSNTVFKRIQFYINTVDYSTDYGYIFESIDTIHINQFNYYSLDIDLKKYEDPSDISYYKLFAIINFMNNPFIYSYKRTYMKAQTLLANIGGIIKGVTIISQILIFFVSNKLLDLELANQVVFPLQKLILEEDYEKSVMKSSKLAQLDASKNPVVKLQNESTLKQKQNTLSLNKIKLRLHEIILPTSCYCNKTKKNQFLKQLSIVYSKLSINNLLKQLQEIEGIKRCLFTNDELKLFEKEFERDDIQSLNGKVAVSKFVSDNPNIKSINPLISSFFEKIKDSRRNKAFEH